MKLIQLQTINKKPSKKQLNNHHTLYKAFQIYQFLRKEFFTTPMDKIITLMANDSAEIHNIKKINTHSQATCTLLGLQSEIKSIKFT